MFIGKDLETNKYLVTAKCTMPVTPRQNESRSEVHSSQTSSSSAAG